ncbi:HAMP domain-containing histidine kinase [Roseococcus sp. SDR]|uniref:sensor histidine kinase n=1 Tax=Roseococcus sp. SDR TaxID=2835532 RepID=UPI001BD16316|nr:HAMP domain-containing sensor histidine kinase [Roseococcus sp. SDR]MBS7788547.1 HAMP domain-containing histidine kinase [Roseococcus sp. SDR]MBV1843861.1 HAMP domain-containing histidine kinase [Roseococcus sp. SDR]
MTRSLRARFAWAGLAMTAMVMLVLGLVLQGLFERHVEREAEAQLEADLRVLGRVVASSEGVWTRLPPLPDPRFLEPYSGLYWQVRDARTGETWRSPSLGGFTLEMQATPPRPGEVHRLILRGPEGGKMIALERPLGEAVGADLRAVVAVDRKVLRAANRAFLWEFLPVLGLLALALLLASLVQGVIALRPIADARRALAALRAGQRERLSGALPAELDGLAQDFDALLEGQRRASRIARERAADLAHGLRTPLALLGARARELEGRGEAEAAKELHDLAAAMEARIARELARAHIHGPARLGGRVVLAPLARRITEALARSPAGARLAWEVAVPEALTLLGDEGDLLELLGSLLDNAGKWARGRVRVTAGPGAVIRVEDDGPGIAPQERRAALTRGVRLDASVSGTGLGLAIAQDIVAAYGGTLELDASEWGGLCVRITLPVSATAG